MAASVAETASARAALNAHAELHLVLNHPSAPLLRSLDRYVTGGRELAEQQKLMGDAGYEGMTAEERALLKSWDYYVWPARTGGDLTRLLAEPLSSAPTYQVTGEIVRAITAMYQATADGEPVLRASEMPSQTGFAYLDEPITLTDFSGSRVVNRALSWGPQTFSPDGIRPVKGTRITSWAEGYLHALRSDSGLGSSSTVFVPYGRPITAGTSDDPTRWLHCLWLFMDTEITVTARERADRASRRRAERAGLRHDEVIVTMLPYHHYEGGGGHREVDWSCRWIVQGHDRHLGDYRSGHEAHHAKPPAPKRSCAVCGVRTTHVRSHVKGPEGLPLKSAAKIFRVT